MLLVSVPVEGNMLAVVTDRRNCDRPVTTVTTAATAVNFVVQ